MLLAAAALLAAAVAGWLAGRRPSARTGGWRLAVLVPVGVLALLAGDRWVGGPVGLGIAATGYGALIIFAAANLRRTGLALIGVGMLANLAVIVVDGGMPVRGLPPGLPAGHQHHGLSRRDHLTALSDTVRVTPLGETVSPGDVLVAVGGAVATFFWLEPRGREREEAAALRAGRLAPPA